MCLRSPVIIFALLAAAGCAHKPALNSYRLLNLDHGPVLIPPGVADPGLTERVFAVDAADGNESCSLHDGAVRLQQRKKKIRTTVNRALLERQRSGWLADWSAKVEAQGCIARGGSEKLARVIVESVPLDPSVAYRLLHTSFLSGYVDLGPEIELEVRSPIPEEALAAAGDFAISRVSGAGNRLDVDLKSTHGAVGYEIAWYGIQPNNGRLGYQFVPLSADRNIQGVIQHMPRPAINYFQFSREAVLFRLFYKTENNGITAIVVGGATRQDLEHRAEGVKRDLTFCKESSGMCIALPARVGVNPFMSVNVNGNNVTVPLGATVSLAIQSAGVQAPDIVLPQLSVTRLFGDRSVPVEFDHRSREILSLQLVGGETISW
jgi:hypothetical protein